MDKNFFEEALSSTLEDLSKELNVENNSEDENIDTTEDIDTTVDDVEDVSTPEDEGDGSESEDQNDDLDDEDEDNQSPSTNDKDVQAFIEMRQKNKQTKEERDKYKATVDYFEELAKASGYKDIDEFVGKLKESQMAKAAKDQGIPVEVLQRINDLERQVSEQDAYRKQLESQQEENRLNSTFDSFIQKNHLDDKSVNDLAQSLVKDDISLDTLRGLSSTAVNRLLESYLPKESIKQKDLAKKEQIKKELPVQNDSKSSSKSQEDQIDEIAKYFARIN